MVVNHCLHHIQGCKYRSGAMQVWLRRDTSVSREPHLCRINGMQVFRISACPVLAVQIAIADGFGQMSRLDMLVAFEVGNGARDL